MAKARRKAKTKTQRASRRQRRNDYRKGKKARATPRSKRKSARKSPRQKTPTQPQLEYPRPTHDQVTMPHVNHPDTQ